MGSLSFYPVGSLDPDLITPPAEVSSAGGLVSERFGAAKDYASDTWQISQNLLDTIANEAYDIPLLNTSVATVGTTAIDGINADEPVRVDVDHSGVANVDFTQSLPLMDEISPINETAPVFSGEQAQIYIPPVPGDEWPIFSASEPALSNPEIPDKPSYTLPVAPIVNEVTVPSPPTFSIASFGGVAPVADLTPPEPMFVYHEGVYSSEVAEALSDKLLIDIQNGGTGLDPDTEQAIWDRARSRKALEDEQSYNEAVEFFSSRGFSMPPGALNGSILEVRARIDQRNADLNNDILVQSSTLAQQNTHFIIEKAVQYEKDLMDHSNQVQQRAFEAARATVEMALAIYAGKVEAFKARLENYKTQALVYEATIRAELARAEIYRAQVEGVKVAVEVQALTVDVYRARLDGIKTLVSLYTAEMEAANVQAKLDKNKIDSFRALVEVYGLKIQAITEKYRAYQAQIAGESEKASVFATQARAYEAQVSAYKTKVEAANSVDQTKIEKYRADVEIYRSAIDKYRADVEAAISRSKMEMEAQGLDVEVYKADIGRYAGEIDAIVRSYLGRVEDNKAATELIIKQAEINLRATIEKYKLKSDAANAAASAAAQIAASAISTVSASATLGYRENRSDSRSYGVSRNVSNSNSKSDSHSYSEAHNHMYQHDG